MARSRKRKGEQGKSKFKLFDKLICCSKILKVSFHSVLNFQTKLWVKQFILLAKLYQRDPKRWESFLERTLLTEPLVNSRYVFSLRRNLRGTSRNLAEPCGTFAEPCGTFPAKEILKKTIAEPCGTFPQLLRNLRGTLREP